MNASYAKSHYRHIAAPIAAGTLLAVSLASAGTANAAVSGTPADDSADGAAQTTSQGVLPTVHAGETGDTPDPTTDPDTTGQQTSSNKAAADTNQQPTRQDTSNQPSRHVHGSAVATAGTIGAPTRRQHANHHRASSPATLRSKHHSKTKHHSKSNHHQAKHHSKKGKAVKVRASWRPAHKGTKPEYVDAGVVVQLKFPKLHKGTWTFRLDRRAADGSWMPAGTWKNRSGRGMAKVNLPYGTYRMSAPAQHGHKAIRNSRLIKASVPDMGTDAGWLPKRSEAAIGYYIHPSAPKGYTTQINQAFKTMSRLSGISMPYRGTTQALKNDNSITVSGKHLAGEKGGFGGYGGRVEAATATSKQKVVLNHIVQLDNSDMKRMTPQGVISLVMHEIGHAIGASHSTRTGDIMYPDVFTAGTHASVWDAEKFERYSRLQQN